MVSRGSPMEISGENVSRIHEEISEGIPGAIRGIIV